jgi:hypothetical protein
MLCIILMQIMNREEIPKLFLSLHIFMWTGESQSPIQLPAKRVRTQPCSEANWEPVGIAFNTRFFARVERPPWPRPRNSCARARRIMRSGWMRQPVESYIYHSHPTLSAITLPHNKPFKLFHSIFCKWIADNSIYLKASGFFNMS